MDKQHKFKLSIISGGVNLRTPTVVGETDQLPTIGQRFVLIGKGLVAGTRIVSTSPVNKIIYSYADPHTLWLVTQNSTYELAEVL